MNRIKICDLGLTKNCFGENMAFSLTLSSLKCGTGPYMSPEMKNHQQNTEKVSYPTDVW